MNERDEPVFLGRCEDCDFFSLYSDGLRGFCANFDAPQNRSAACTSWRAKREHAT